MADKELSKGKVAPCDRCGDERAVYTFPSFCVCPVCDTSPDTPNGRDCNAISKAIAEIFDQDMIEALGNIKWPP